ncbi:MAG TPA: 1,2-phenylacetyl-CoA epoxidase subunit PaaD [bacterium]|nr:1,2-phenylacetyl-CoA epoxidase subunit PaaD [bacterium]
MQAVPTEQAVWEVLGTIQDPELPIAITDLGLIGAVRVEGASVHVTMVPTFSACPAVGVIQDDIRASVRALPGVQDVTVALSFAEPWTMARMTERGREQLRGHGLSVPRRTGGGQVTCPFCGSTNTRLENPFGTTLCRAIYYCLDCRNPIERFRPPAD